jgi:hypothetical protein
LGLSQFAEISMPCLLLLICRGLPDSGRTTFSRMCRCRRWPRYLLPEKEFAPWTSTTKASGSSETNAFPAFSPWLELANCSKVPATMPAFACGSALVSGCFSSHLLQRNPPDREAPYTVSGPVSRSPAALRPASWSPPTSPRAKIGRYRDAYSFRHTTRVYSRQPGARSPATEGRALGVPYPGHCLNSCATARSIRIGKLRFIYLAALTISIFSSVKG